MSDLGNVGAEMLLTKGIPYLGKNAVEDGKILWIRSYERPKIAEKSY